LPLAPKSASVCIFLWTFNQPDILTSWLNVALYNVDLPRIWVSPDTFNVCSTIALDFTVNDPLIIAFLWTFNAVEEALVSNPHYI